MKITEFYRREHRKENRNPDGLTYYDFRDRYKDTPHLAELCWFIGMYPEDLIKELEILKNRI